MKLIDRIKSTNKLSMPRVVSPVFEQRWGAHANKIRDILCDPQLTILNVDNVAEYYYRGTDQEYWDLKRDFPNLAPPFNMFWIEHKTQTFIHSKEKGDTDIGHLGLKDPRTGFLFMVARPEDVKVAKPSIGDEDGPSGIPEGTQWIYAIEMFNYWGFDPRENYVEGPTGTFFLFIDKEGRLLQVPQMQAFTSQAAIDRDPTLGEVLKASMMWTHPSLLAISFLHCRNVKTVDVETPEKLAKRTMERHGYRPSNYKTLIIEPLKEILRKEGRSGEVGLAKAMHICRGHFKDYREGRGLFGKYHQIVWHPQTVRGTRHQKDEKPAPREIEVKLA